MIAWIIELSAKYRWFVFLIYGALMAGACVSVSRVQLDGGQGAVPRELAGGQAVQVVGRSAVLLGSTAT